VRKNISRPAPLPFNRREQLQHAFSTSGTTIRRRGSKSPLAGASLGQGLGRVGIHVPAQSPHVTFRRTPEMQPRSGTRLSIPGRHEAPAPIPYEEDFQLTLDERLHDLKLALGPSGRAV
jgi:hypothetical protein